MPVASPLLARLSMIATMATMTVTIVHHVFRLGFEVLAPGVGLIAGLAAFLLWFHRTGNRIALWVYALLTGLVVVWFGIIDGFLDHVLKAVGLANTTFLPGGDAEVVPTVYSLWSPQASVFFYEGTGVLTFLASVFAAYFAYQLLRSPTTSDTTR